MFLELVIVFYSLARWLILLFFLQLSCFAQVLELESLTSYQDTSKQVQVFFDKDEEQDVNTILSQKFQSTQSSNIGYLKGVAWSKLELKTQKKQELFFINPRVNINSMEVYVFKDGVLMQSYKLGNYEKVNLSKFSHFELLLEKDSVYTIISKLQSKSTIDVNWILTKKDDFMGFIIFDMFFWGVFAGLILSLIIYNFSIFNSLRDFSYIAYIFHGFFALVFQFATNGVFYQMGLYGDLKIYNSIAWLSVELNLVFALLFAMLFFNTKKTMPFLHKLIKFFMLVNLAFAGIFLYSFLDIAIIEELRFVTKPLGFMSIFFLLSIAIVAVVKNLIGSKYYIIGHGLFLFALLFQQFGRGIEGDMRYVSLYIVAFGMLADVVFLSIALSKRVYALKHEKEVAQKLLISQSSFFTIGQTVGNLAHQWKVPIVQLGSLLMQMEACLWNPKENFENQMHSIISKMRTSLGFMGESIDEFNSFYRSVGKKTNYNPALEVENILEMLSAKILYSQVKIEVMLDRDIKLEGFKNAFTNVVLILIDNAIETFKNRDIQDGTIKIELSWQENQCKLVVKDNGGGIKIEPIEKVFEFFVSENGKGQGMGLALCEMLVKTKLQGSIKVSNEHEGACFQVKF